MDNLNVCIDIWSIENRGDWLMFEAVLREVRHRLPAARVGVPERAYDLAPDFYAQRRILPVPYPRRGLQERLRRAVNDLLCRLRRRNAPLYADRVDLMLFAPGFRLSDQFGDYGKQFYIRERNWFGAFTRPGRKLIFLPQAFGPFETDWNRERMQALVPLVSHFYARETTSYRMLVDFLAGQGSVSIAPDFTCLVPGEPGHVPYPSGGYVVVVPNRQMLTRTAGGIPRRYCDFVFGLVKRLRERGENIVLLNHESMNDDALLDVLNASIDNAACVVRNVSGPACKGVIAGARLLVTSRFHGLVSALSEGAPVLCTSWSHKYQELVAEYGVPQCCLDLSDAVGALGVVEKALEKPSDYATTPARREAVCRKTLDMWDEVFAGVKDRGNPRRAVRKLLYVGKGR